MSVIRLGLIGDNIAMSRSPMLHRACGRLLGLEVDYALFIPPGMGLPFEAVLEQARRDGLQGVNVTLPYKERVVAHVRAGDPFVARLGAMNTVRFGADGMLGFNTDHTGFVAAYRRAFGQARPGRVALIGAGGVGKAVAFALARLGATEVIVIDTRADVAGALAQAVAGVDGAAATARAGTMDDIRNADGVMNCTPLGMHGYPGTPVPEGMFPRNAWAFDAVYTPPDTAFRAQARRAGARFLSGHELYFHQGVQAFEIFTGLKVDDLDEVRTMLDMPEPEGAI